MHSANSPLIARHTLVLWLTGYLILVSPWKQGWRFVEEAQLVGCGTESWEVWNLHPSQWTLLWLGSMGGLAEDWLPWRPESSAQISWGTWVTCSITIGKGLHHVGAHPQEVFRYLVGLQMVMSSLHALGSVKGASASVKCTTFCGVASFGPSPS